MREPVWGTAQKKIRWGREIRKVKRLTTDGGTKTGRRRILEVFQTAIHVVQGRVERGLGECRLVVKVKEHLGGSGGGHCCGGVELNEEEKGEGLEESEYE